jgi:hypothetical protein
MPAPEMAGKSENFSDLDAKSRMVREIPKFSEFGLARTVPPQADIVRLRLIPRKFA